MTNWIPPDDVKEKAQQAYSTTQDTAQNALSTGGEYMRENKIPVILGAVLVGAVLGALLVPKRRKEPDAVQAVRDWMEKTLEELSEQWPKARKQARSIQDDLAAQAQSVGKKLHSWSR
ncbi:MAG: YtxH domain-containing protein [Terrimicrobiaceae bacterium]